MDNSNNETEMEGPVSFVVGRPFPFQGAAPATDGAYFEMMRGEMAPLFVSFVSNPTKDEIRRFTGAPLECGIFYRHPVLIVTFNFEGAFTFSCPFDSRRIPDEERTLSDLDSTREVPLLTCVLVDKAKSIVKAIRGVTLHPEAAADLWTGIQEQMSREYTQTEFNSTLSHIYETFPDDRVLHLAANPKPCGVGPKPNSGKRKRGNESGH